MKKYLIVAALLLSGCATTEMNMTSERQLSTYNDLSKVHKGMTYSQVTKILGDKIIIGYKHISNETGQAEPIYLENPYREEIITKDGSIYKIDYYLTSIKKADGLISEEELTPLTFQGERLVSKDWDFLYEIKTFVYELKK